MSQELEHKLDQAIKDQALQTDCDDAEIAKIKAELAALDEPKLERFSVTGGYPSGGFTARLKRGLIKIGINGYDDWGFDLDEATEIHQKLGQLIATAKKKS